MAWGPLDRLGNVLGGLGGAAQAPVGLLWDLGRAPFTEDGQSGILGTVNASVMDRSGQFFGRLFGPESGVGAAIGGLPNQRKFAGQPIQWSLQKLEWLGDRAIRRPLSALVTAGSLGSSERFRQQEGLGDSSLLALFDQDTWSTAWEISEEQSPGQSVALLLGTKDILDEDEVENFAGTDAYQFASGTFDALVRWFLEPDRLAFGGGAAIRQGSRKAQGLLPAGTVFETTPPQIGTRAARTRTLGPRIQRINQSIDRGYERLPGPLRSLVEKERVFGPQDAGRLHRLELTRSELRTFDLERQAARTADPARAQLLGNVVSSRRAREARLAAGQPGAAQRRIAEEARLDIDRYFTSPPGRGQVAAQSLGGRGWHRLNEFIDTLPANVDERAGQLRDRLFPTHHRGDTISRYLAEADGLAEREQVMRVFLGDMRGVRNLEQSNYSLATRLQDLMMDRATIRSEPIMELATFGRQPGMATEAAQTVAETGRVPDWMTEAGTLADDYALNRTRLARVEEEIEGVAAATKRNEDLLHAAGSLGSRPPTVSRRAMTRHSIKSSTLYQDSLWGKPVRVIFDMRPHHIVGASDINADANLSRMMTEAGFPVEDIERARGEFMGLAPDRRGEAFQRWVGQAERRVLADAGLDADEMAQVLDMARLRRGEADGLVRSARYDAEGRARVRLPGSDELVDIPLWVTQLQDAVTVPNFRRLRREAERYARLKYGDDWRSAIGRRMQPTHTARQFGAEGMRGLMDAWKVGVLLRPAWTLRVVGDEQMRMIAKFGALSVALGARTNINNYMAELKKNPIMRRVLRTDDVARGTRRGAFMGALAGTVGAGPLGAMAGGTLGGKLVRKTAQAEARGYDNIRFGGHSLSGPFGSPGSRAEFYRSHVSASAAVNDIFGTHENWMFQSMRRNTNQWRTHRWGDSDAANQTYRAEWARQMRHQLAQDEMAKQFLAGKSTDEVLDWMDNTLEGKRYASMVPYRWDHQAWVEAGADQVQRYTGGREDVGRRVLETSDRASDETWSEILDLIPETERRPVHGAELEQVLARGPVQQAISGFTNNAFDILGTMATDNLSRNPTFGRFYQSEMQRLVGDKVPGRVSGAQLERWEGQARDFALRETRELLYDMAERSQFSEMVRFMIPFYPAWQEVLTRWAGLVAERPAILSRARAVWYAPDRAGWTYTNDRGDTFLRIPIPSWAQGLVNQGALSGALDSQGYVFLDKAGFNLVAQGTPGAGPIVQWAVSDMVKANPSLEDSVKFILPYGPSDSLLEAFTPPTVKRALAVSANDEGAARANVTGRIIQTRLTMMEQGEIPMVDMSDPAARRVFLDDVESEVDSFMKLRLFTGLVAPVAPLYESPYKPYVDIYRALRDGDYQRASDVAAEFGVDGEGLPEPGTPVDPFASDDLFLEAFGEEFFALTQSFSESADGVPATVEGLETGETYRDLLDRYPEWGGVVAGYDGGGEAVKWSRAVYDRQLAEGSRRRLTADEIATRPDERLGWAKYSKAMDAIDVVRIARGLPNLQVEEASTLRLLKEMTISHLASEHPAWYREYSVTDRQAMERRIEGARAVVADPVLARRPDIRGLAEYLQLRDRFSLLLAVRDAKTLSAQANTDLAGLWLTMVNDLTERNPEFADLWVRKLEHDVPTVPNLPGV